MPRKGATAITFQPSDEEREILELYCRQVDMTKSTVLRELIRGLRDKIKPSHQLHTALKIVNDQEI